MSGKQNNVGVLRTSMEWIAGSAWRYFTLIFLLSLTIRVYELNQVPARSLIPSSERELGAITISLMRTGQFAHQ
jgi:hypothetical protein